MDYYRKNMLVFSHFPRGFAIPTMYQPGIPVLIRLEPMHIATETNGKMVAQRRGLCVAFLD
jgi:hypothetical protein